MGTQPSGRCNSLRKPAGVFPGSVYEALLPSSGQDTSDPWRKMTPVQLASCSLVLKKESLYWASTMGLVHVDEQTLLPYLH